MLQTIMTASHISVQGEFVKRLADGRVMVRVGAMRFVGNPIRAMYSNVVPVAGIG